MGSVPDHARLGALVDRYQMERARRPDFVLENLREEAGELYPELVRAVRGLGVIEACFADEIAGDDAAPLPPRARRRLPVAIALVGAVVGAAVWTLRPVAGEVVDVVAFPPGELLVDGRSVGATPWRGAGRELRVRLSGFLDATRRAVPGDGPIVFYLEPVRPFDAGTLRRLGEAYGTHAPPLPTAPPPRVRGDADVPAEALRPDDPEALARELKRYPAPVRGWPSIRVLAIANLAAAGRLAEAFDAAHALASEPGAGPIALRFQLEVLWKLDLVETRLYRQLHGAWEASLR